MSLAGTVWNFGRRGDYWGPLRLNADGTCSGFQGTCERWWKEDPDGTITLWGDDKTVFPPTPSRTKCGHRGPNPNSHWIRQITNNSITILGDEHMNLGDAVFMANVFESLRHLPLFLRISRRAALLVREMGFHFTNGIDEDGIIVNWEKFAFGDRRALINPWHGFIPMLCRCGVEVAHMAPALVPPAVPDDQNKAYDFAFSNKHSGKRAYRDLPQEIWSEHVAGFLKSEGFTLIDLDTINPLDQAILALKKSRFAVTIDSGWQHMAAIYRIPQITFYNAKIQTKFTKYSYHDQGIQTIIMFDQIEKFKEAVWSLTGRASSSAAKTPSSAP